MSLICRWLNHSWGDARFLLYAQMVEEQCVRCDATRSFPVPQPHAPHIHRWAYSRGLNFATCKDCGENRDIKRRPKQKELPV